MSSGRYPSIPPVYSASLRRVIASLLRIDPSERLTSTAMLRSPELVGKLQLEGDKMEDIANENDVMRTIVVPQNLRRLSVVLPKPCYPDIRPYSPTSWTVADQKVHAVRVAESIHGIEGDSTKAEVPLRRPLQQFPQRIEGERAPAPPPIRPRQPLSNVPSRIKPLRTFQRPSEGHRNQDGRAARNRIF